MKVVEKFLVKTTGIYIIAFGILVALNPQLMTTALALENNPDVYTCKIETHFTPREDMDVLIAKQLDSAKHNVYLSLFGESNELLTEKLIELKQRGVDVRVAVDHRQSMLPSSMLPRLNAVNIPILVKPSLVLEHNKVAVIDAYRDSKGKVVILPTATAISGSWNWSKSANNQDNNDTFYHCATAVQKYLEDYEYIVRRDSQ